MSDEQEEVYYVSEAEAQLIQHLGKLENPTEHDLVRVFLFLADEEQPEKLDGYNIAGPSVPFETLSAIERKDVLRELILCKLALRNHLLALADDESLHEKLKGLLKRKSQAGDNWTQDLTDVLGSVREALQATDNGKVPGRFLSLPRGLQECFFETTLPATLPATLAPSASLKQGNTRAGRLGAVGFVLDNSPEHLQDTANSVRAPGELYRELSAHLAELSREIQPTDDPKQATNTLGQRLARLGAHGKAQAKKLTDSTSNPWRLKDNGCVAVYLLAEALWVDIVGPRLRKPSALVFPVHTSVTEIHSRTMAPVERGGQRVLPLSYGDALIIKAPTTQLDNYADDTLQRHVENGLRLMGSMTGHRLLRWQVFEGHNRAMSGEPDFRQLNIEGGWAALAEELGLNPKKAKNNVRDIVLAQAHLCIELPDGSKGNLLAVRYAEARGQRRAFVGMTLGSALLPNYVHELTERIGRKSLKAREARRLVPVLDLPPFVGRKNEHGAQATLSLSLVAYLRKHARELAQYGGVLMPLDTFAGLAKNAGLPSRLIGAVRDRWTQKDDGFLKREEPDRYTLGDIHQEARAFMEQAGRDELQAATAGRLGAKSRKARRQK